MWWGTVLVGGQLFFFLNHHVSCKYSPFCYPQASAVMAFGGAGRMSVGLAGQVGYLLLGFLQQVKYRNQTVH